MENLSFTLAMEVSIIMRLREFHFFFSENEFAGGIKFAKFTCWPAAPHAFEDS
jgi:hypothetical protein